MGDYRNESKNLSYTRTIFAIELRIYKYNFNGIITCMNKSAFKVTSLRESEDYDFWRNKTHLERLEGLEKLRRIIFGYDPSTQRLQRILKVTQLKKH